MSFDFFWDKFITCIGVGLSLSSSLSSLNSLILSWGTPQYKRFLRLLGRQGRIRSKNGEINRGSSDLGSVAPENINAQMFCYPQREILVCHSWVELSDFIPNEVKMYTSMKNHDCEDHLQKMSLIIHLKT